MITKEMIEQAAKDIYGRRSGRVFAENSRPDLVIAFIAGAEWAIDQQQWISVRDRLPDPGTDCLFIVDSANPEYHGRILGGRYIGGYGKWEFATPGIGFFASHWQLSPQPPKTEQP